MLGHKKNSQEIGKYTSKVRKCEYFDSYEVISLTDLFLFNVRDT